MFIHTVHKQYKQFNLIFISLSKSKMQSFRNTLIHHAIITDTTRQLTIQSIMNRRKLIRQLKAGKNEIVLDTPETMQLFDSKD